MPNTLSQPAQEKANPRLFDGFMRLSRGVQSGRAKVLLSSEHASFAVNTTFRYDHPRCRPGWNKLPLTYASSTTQVDVETHFTEGRFQGATAFQALNGEGHLVAHIGGRLFRIDVQHPSKVVTDVSVLTAPTPAWDVNDSTTPQVWFAQTPGWLVVQNGQAQAIIYDGNTARRAVPQQREVPCGTVMAYGQGRLWVTLPDRRSFVASNLIYDPSTGTDTLQFRDSVLRFTENELIDAGASFGVPIEAGLITSMKFAGNMDNSTGQAPLSVFTDDSVFTVDAPFDRELWAQMQSPIQTVGLPTGGSSGANAVTAVNGDLWFRDRLGVRSFQVARREFGQWNNTPLSRAVSEVLDHDDLNRLGMVSAAEFDNRMLMTVCPQQVWGRGVVHLGLVALDFAKVSDTDDLDISSKLPAWEGLWTGLRILQVVTGSFNKVKRCFVFALNPDTDDIEVWELTRDAWYDAYDNPIEWKLYTPEYTFGDSTILKELKMAELWIRDLQGNSANKPTLAISYRPDEYPNWTDWYEWSLCPESFNCGEQLCTGVMKQAQTRACLHLPEPEDACRPGQRDAPMRQGYTLSTRFVVTGAMTLSRYRMHGIPKTDPQVGECQNGEECESIALCLDNYWSYTTEA